MFCRRWSFKQTNLLVKSDRLEALRAAIEAAFEARQQIERFVIRYPEFRYSLEPLRLRSNGWPKVIELMLRAGEIANVGPFAAVAGSISQIASDAALEAGARSVLVENGGDISIAGNREFRVGLYAGDSKISGKVGFLFRPKDLPAGVCTSSGTVGPSMSFGEADAVTVIADEASVADAAATSVANEVGGADVGLSIARGLDRADEIPEVRGCLIVRAKGVGTTGKLPELIQLRIPKNFLSK